MQTQGRQSEPREEHLAFMIAQAFNDEERATLYLYQIRKYPLEIVHRAFNDAKNFPQEKIKKSRAAFFFYLLKTYAHRSN